MIRKLAVLPLAAAALLAAPHRVSAAEAPQIVVFLVHGASFEQLLDVPEVRALARGGGAALMSARTVAGDRGPGAYLTLGTGVRSAAPEARVVEAPVDGVPHLVHLRAYAEENRGRSTPGLLGTVLDANEVRPCLTGTLTGPGLLMAMNRDGLARIAQPHPRIPCDLTIVDHHGSAGFRESGVPMLLGQLIQTLTQRLPGHPSHVLVMVIEAKPSVAMDRDKDELTPIVMAEGDPATLFDATGATHTLTSDTTRRDGVVSNEDVAPTILRFFGIPVPSDMNGSPIRLVDAPAPFALHAKHLENRRATVPIQIGAGIAVTMFGLVSLGLVLLRDRVPERLRRVAPILPLLIIPLAVALVAAGRLPHETYPWVVPFLVAVTVAGGVAAWAFLRRGVLVPVAVLGAAAIAFFVVEALQGWPDTRFTLLGGTALDGARFYGLPNNMIGLLAAAGLWVAAVLPPFGGFALLAGLALFAGFPDLGADLGGALTLLVAAGLWLVLSSQKPTLWRGLATVAAVAVVGMAVVLAAQVVFGSTPTHGTRFVENAGSNGIGHLFDTFKDRLLIGWRLLLRDPFAFVPVLGLPVALVVVLRPPPVVRAGFGRHPEWRTALAVLVLASMVAYVVNDTGAAAVGLGFGLAAAGILYLPLAEMSRGTRTSPGPLPP